MVWSNGPLILYHGTLEAAAIDLEKSKPDPTIGRIRVDFGRGFYTTRRLLPQERANWRFQRAWHLFQRDPNNHRDPGCAAIVEYAADRNLLGQLDALAFVLPEEGWREFVKNCKYDTFEHKGTGSRPYDIVYGPVATAAVETGTYYEQLSFHSDAAIAVLQLVRVRRGNPLFR